MAKQQFGITDGFRGKVGPVIGYRWHGKWCVRSFPAQVRNPRTPLQQAGRTVFGAASTLAMHMSSALRPGLHAAASRLGMSARNLFIRLNRDVVRLDDGVATVDFSALTLAQGPVAPVGFAAVEADGPFGFRVPFERNPTRGRAGATDRVWLYAWCVERGCGLLSQPSVRRGGVATVALPREWQGATVHLYGFATDFKGFASASAYLGAVSLSGGDATGAADAVPSRVVGLSVGGARVALPSALPGSAAPLSPGGVALARPFFQNVECQIDILNPAPV